MAPEKVTVMILNVDLKCSCCYKKVKKLLCKFPQITDQVFDEDKNKVRITVVCCNPEKIRDKLCCKGGNSIQSIEILEDKPKPPPQKPKHDPPPVVLPKPDPPKPDPPKPDPPKPAPPKLDPPKPVDPPKPDPPKSAPAPAPAPPKPDPPKPDPPKVDPPKPAPAPPKPDPPPPKLPEPVMIPDPMHEYPQPFCPPAYPVSVCCQECYEGRGGGPCHYGYGRPVPPPPGPCYDGYGYPYAGNRACYVTRCDYFSEDNPQGCSIM